MPAMAAPWVVSRAVPAPYRSSALEAFDRRFRHCLSGSAALAVVALIAIFLAPLRETKVVSVSTLPPRVARLILEKPAPPPRSITLPAPDRVLPRITPPRVEPSEATPAPAPVLPRTTPGGRRPDAPSPSAPTADRGAAGRAEAARALGGSTASVSSTLETTLASVNSALRSQSASTTTNARRSTASTSTLRAARSADQVAPSASAGAGAGGGNSALGGSLLAVGTITNVRSAGGGASGGRSPDSGSAAGAPGGRRARHTGSGTSAGDAGAADDAGGARSAASLLAVVRKYSAAIQLCYDEELQRDPSRRGKLSVEITVAASGEVRSVQVIEDTVGSPQMTACVRAKIQSWRFPAAPGDDVAFRAPFVFTPPR